MRLPGSSSPAIIHYRRVRLRFSSLGECRSAQRTRGEPSPLIAQSFPRKRESGRLQPSPLSEIKHESQSADPFSLYGLTRVGLRPRSAGVPPAEPPSSPAPFPRHSRFSPVIPAKAGIQTLAAKPAAQTQVRIASDKSPLPLWERARVRVTRASAAVANDHFVRKPTPASPLWEKARMRARRAQARLAGGTLTLTAIPPLPLRRLRLSPPATSPLSF